jgi:alkanesulfonate monooxygenase SsuD/methylene tetrahydromethanopterin reductase-like flavin-dependent oxidoreductase (luciferase family)
MKFGLQYDLRNPQQSGRRTADLYRDTLKQIQLAEELGFDDIWLSEHHFIDDGYLPSLLPFAGAVAGQTQRVNIGTNILLMPFHHPIRIAEDCAVVDNISDGRFMLGAAVGYRLEEFATFDINRKHRGSITEEAFEIIRACWTEEEFDYTGKHFNFQGVRCTPKPAHNIPLWVGAHMGEAIRRAARLGDGLLGGGPAGRAAYIEALKAYGKDAENPRIASSGRFIFCSREPAKDWAKLSKHALYQMQLYASWFSAAGETIFGEPPKDIPELESRGIYRVGTPDEIAEIIRTEHAAAPYERHFFFPIWPGVDVDMASSSVRLFAEEVIPKLKDL